MVGRNKKNCAMHKHRQGSDLSRAMDVLLREAIHWTTARASRHEPASVSTRRSLQTRGEVSFTRPDRMTRENWRPLALALSLLSLQVEAPEASPSVQLASLRSEAYGPGSKWNGKQAR